MKGKSDYLIL